jgi:hypothetical protein
VDCHASEVIRPLEPITTPMSRLATLKTINFAFWIVRIIPPFAFGQLSVRMTTGANRD